MSELKPCPFCGSGYIDTGCLTVGCCRCGANGPEGYEGTAETWNDRPIEDALRAEVAALKAECAEAWRVHSEVVAELKAKLAKYTEPLTDDQIVAIEKATAHLPRFGNRSDWWDMRDAAIRAAREGAR